MTVVVHSGSQLCHVWLTELVGPDDFEEVVCQALHESLDVGSDDFDDSVHADQEKVLELVGSEDLDELDVDHAPQPDSLELVEDVVLVG